MLTLPIARGITAGITRGLLGAAVGDPLAFHALADVDGSFVNDVIIGTGSITEANTSTRYYADDSAIWQPFTTGAQPMTFAGTKWWEVGQKATTNDQIQSADLTNVEWTATTMTVTKDQTGMRNDASGACLLIATAANATVVANAITDASDDQTTRWFIKRSVGTGTVNITVDGGSTWQDVTTEVDSTAGFNECLEDQAALANPQIGIRLVVDTDAVIVGNAEAFLGDLKEEIRQSSPVFTVAAPISIGASGLSVDDANHDDTEGLWFCEFRNAGLNAVNTGGLIGLGPSGRLRYASADTQLRGFDGAQVAQGPTITLAADDTVYKTAIAFGSSLMRSNTDGTYGAEVAYDGAFNNTASKIMLLASENFGGPPSATLLIRDIRRYALPYAQAQLKIDELMA